MRQLFLILVLALPLGLSGCASSPQWPAYDREAPLVKIVGIDQDKFFVDAQGRRFFPWGFNYTNPDGIGLIDDNLYAEQMWSIIDQDFAEMKSYDANVARVHLQYNKFMLGPATPDLHAFAALDRLVRIAEKHRVYLMITGLGAYRKSESPEWYNQLSTSERWASQALFWRTLAAQVGHSEAVFAYDLMNEPVVAVCPDDGQPCDWSTGEPAGGFHFIQNITLEPGAPFLDTMTSWKNQLHRAIRQVDDTTLTTVGHLPFVPLNDLDDELDFLSIHIYPREYHLGRAVAKVKTAVTARPLVISEYFNLYCNREDLDYVLNAIDGDYQGLMGHYRGKTLAELEAIGGTDNWFWGGFLQFFVTHNPNLPAARTATF